MGAFIYGSPAMELQFDDRTLSHLQVVVGGKLRRGESFFFSWKQADHGPEARSSIWLSPAIPMMFKYSGGRTPALNVEWVFALEDSANSTRGLVLLPEPRSSGAQPDGRGPALRTDR